MPLVCKECDILRSSETLHVDPDRPWECFGAISLQSCDARQARLTSQPAAPGDLPGWLA